MAEILTGWLIVCGASYGAASYRGLIKRIALIGLPVAGLLLLFVGRELSPAMRLLASSLFMMYAIKGASSTRDPKVPMGWRRPVAMFVWPGFDHEHFAEAANPRAETAKRFVTGLVWMIFGSAVGLATAIWAPSLGAATGWLGIASILAFVHFGISNVMTSLLWLIGIPVRPLFENPLQSKSLRDFWGARWNIAFAEMDRRLFIRPLSRRFGLRGAVFGVFVISGLLHEMAISYPAGGGWGAPLLYFCIQGLLVLAEKRFRLGGRIWTFVWVLAPLPILFHAPFRERLIIPLFLYLHQAVVAHPLVWWFDKGLWVLGGLQLCVLLASFQVPRRLKWHEELPRLSPFNQKLMWTYGVTVAFTIAAFGAATLGLHGNMLRGEPAALAIAGFAAIFWTFRLLCDAFYFRSEDWPEGVDLQIGHALLNTLFASLLMGYSALVLWHLVA